MLIFDIGPKLYFTFRVDIFFYCMWCLYNYIKYYIIMVCSHYTAY